MPDQEKAVNWSLTLRAALIMAAVGLGFSGLFQLERVGSAAHWQDVISSFFTLFGYISAFGFAIGWTLPDTKSDERGSTVNWNSRRGFWEGSLGAASLFAIGVAALHFLR